MPTQNRPQVLNNNYFVNNKKKLQSKIPKSLAVLFLSFVYLLGLDHGFTKIINKKFRPLAKIGILFMSCVIIIIVIRFPFERTTFHTCLFYGYILQYSIYFLVLKNSKYTVYELINDINDIAQLSTNNNIEISFLMYWIVMLIIKVALCCSHCLYNSFLCIDSALPPITYCVMAHVMDVMTIVRFIIMYYILISVSSFKKNFTTSNYNLTTIRNKYIDIANVCDKIRPLYAISVSKFL